MATGSFTRSNPFNQHGPMRTKQEQLQRIVSEYRIAGGSWPAESRAIAEWAVRTGRWRPHPQAAEKQCARELSRAMREEYYVDEKGRRVRVKHAVTKDQGTLWDDIRTAPREHMLVAFQQRRSRIFDDCRQLKTDAESYNDTHPHDRQIQLVFDFTEDLAELEAMDAA